MMESNLRAVADVDATAADTFEGLVEAQHARLFRALFLITGNRAEAEEVMQDAFLAVWERWDRVGGMEDPTGYLFRTAMNLWRKRVRRASVALRRAVGPTLARDDFEAAETKEVVFAALRELSPKERAAIVTTALLGYTSEEAGRILGLKAATVRMYASRARSEMQRTVER